MRFTRKLSTFEGVAVGQVATLRLPTGMTYHQLFLKYSGMDLADIEEIKIVANGKPIQIFRSGAELDKFNQFDGRAAAADDGILVIDFERIGMLRREGREHTAIGTGKAKSDNNPFPINTMEVQIQIGAGATAPAFTAKAVQSPARGTGIIKKVRTFTYSPSGAGDFEIADLPKASTINRILFQSSNISELTVESDNYIVYQRTKAENDRIQADGIRKPVADMFPLDTTELGYTGEGLPTRYADGREVSDLRFRLNMAAADTVEVTVEYLDVLGN
jgi:hypothetical protein